MHFPVLIACLSPEEMLRSHIIGIAAATFAIGVTLALVFLSWQHRTFQWLPLYAVLLLIHPAWTMGVVGGDCGQGKQNLSYAISLVFIALLIRQVLRPEFRMHRFLCYLAVVALGGFAAHQLYVNFGLPFIGAPPEFMADYVLFGYPLLLPFGVGAGIASGIGYVFSRRHARATKPNHATMERPAGSRTI